MAMKEKPQAVQVKNGICWKNSFESFKVTVYVPQADEKLKSDILNYGFIAPYILIFAAEDYSFEQAVEFADKNNFTKLATDFASSVVFVYPLADGGWKNASKNLFSEIISNSKIHEYYENGFINNWNRFTKQIDGHYIRGAIFRTCLFGFKESADYIAQNCINHFEGDGLWGRSDLAPVTCFLSGLSVEPVISSDDIPLVSYENSKQIEEIIKKKAKYNLCKEKEDFYEDFYSFARKFRRMNGPLIIDEDVEKDGLIREPGIAEVKTSSDNNGDDKGTVNHKIGYFAFYNKGLLDKGPLPLVLGFHGGGDSCFFFSIMAGWAKIAHRHNFLLVTVENHLNSTATEMIEFVELLKKKYPIDESRIYATGFSMGGIKTWDIIQEYPLMIAAAAPMDATVDIGENVYFQKIQKPYNTTVSVPVFYAGGEITPLPELPFQEQKCLNRMKYALELNKTQKEYNLSLKNKDSWENKIWGIDGDFCIKKYDETRNSNLIMQIFKNKDEKIYNVFASISDQGHDCREHTCEHAWRFMSHFSRNKDGTINGGETDEILESLKRN